MVVNFLFFGYGFFDLFAQRFLGRGAQSHLYVTQFAVPAEEQKVGQPLTPKASAASRLPSPTV